MSDYTVGQDCQVAVVGPFGDIDIPLQTKFEAKQVQTPSSVKTINGTRVTRTIFDNWTGSFTFARGDATLDDLALQFEQASLAGTPIPKGSITYQVKERDGTTRRWQLVNCTFTTDLGSFAADAAVMQTLAFQAERRIAA